MDPLFSDGQVAALVAAIATGAAAVASAIKWLGGRLVKAIDDIAAESKAVREQVVELKAEVKEGRADIAEIRDKVSPRPVRRDRTDPSLPRGLRRANTEDDR